jgi:hypothetical protein
LGAVDQVVLFGLVRIVSAACLGEMVKVFHDWNSYRPIQEDLAVANFTFSSPDLSTFCGLDELGLKATGQSIERGRAVLECRPAVRDSRCGQCGAKGRALGTQGRRLCHVPFGARPTTLLVRVPRFRCDGCGRVWRQDVSKAAASRDRWVTTTTTCVFA